jgi:hypothetical protein
MGTNEIALYVGTMTPLLPAAYLTAVTWAIIASNKRLATTLWVVMSLAAVVGVAFFCSLIWPFEAALLGHLAAPAAMITSALAGISHMRMHTRAAAPKA